MYFVLNGLPRAVSTSSKNPEGICICNNANSQRCHLKRKLTCTSLTIGAYAFKMYYLHLFCIWACSLWHEYSVYCTVFILLACSNNSVSQNNTTREAIVNVIDDLSKQTTVPQIEIHYTLFHNNAAAKTTIQGRFVHHYCILYVISRITHNSNCCILTCSKFIVSNLLTSIIY